MYNIQFAFQSKVTIELDAAQTQEDEIQNDCFD